MIKYLENEFTGTGEVKGFKFRKITTLEHVYLYEVSSSDGNVWYEYFKRLNTPICIDFEKRLYSDTEFKEIYPKAKDFGITAWCLTDFDRARLRAEQLNDQEINKLKEK